MRRGWALRTKRGGAGAMLAAAVAVPLLGSPDPGRASAGGPFPGFTGAPGEQTCRHCHDTFPLNLPGGVLRVDGFPERYVPGDTYDVTVSLESPSGLSWGFQATVLTGKRKMAGKLILTDRSTTKVVPGIFATDRRYVEQRRAGTFAGQRGGASWQFVWRAPKRDKGPVTIYIAGNAANGNGDKNGDFIYYLEQTSQPVQGTTQDTAVTVEQTSE